MALSNKSIAFFGATGGCAGACLAHCLEAGYTCTALVRNPSKLTSLLSAHNISSSTIASYLTIITGNVKNPADVAQTILPTTAIIISGIGSTIARKPGDFIPKIVDSTLCADGMNTILSVLRTKRATGLNPLVIAVSTTGISKYGRDTPLLMAPLYSVLLHVPHQDKRKMENALIAAGAEQGSGVGAYAIVRASLLTDGKETGKVKSDLEDGKVAAGAIGYTISRNDVGAFIFEELVQKFKGPSGKGSIMSVTSA